MVPSRTREIPGSSPERSSGLERACELASLRAYYAANWRAGGPPSLQDLELRSVPMIGEPDTESPESKVDAACEARYHLLHA